MQVMSHAQELAVAWSVKFVNCCRAAKTTLGAHQLGVNKNVWKSTGYCKQCAAASVVEVRLAADQEIQFRCRQAGAFHTQIPSPTSYLYQTKTVEGFVSLSWSPRSC